MQSSRRMLMRSEAGRRLAHRTVRGRRPNLSYSRSIRCPDHDRRIRYPFGLPVIPE